MCLGQMTLAQEEWAGEGSPWRRLGRFHILEGEDWASPLCSPQPCLSTQLLPGGKAIYSPDRQSPPTPIILRRPSPTDLHPWAHRVSNMTY